MRDGVRGVITGAAACIQRADDTNRCPTGNRRAEGILTHRKRRWHIQNVVTITPSEFNQLSDPELLARVHLAAQSERRATAHLIALLIELDSRRLYLGEGFSSLFTYCTQALHLSEHAAYNRIEAARAARRFPVILELIAESGVTLTSVRLLAPHLTQQNHREVLERARHKSKRDIELLVAGLHPQPDVPPAVRKLPMPAVAKMPAAKSTELVTSAGIDAPVAMAPANEVPASRPAAIKPIAPERYKVQFTVDRETYDKLRRAQDLLRHAVPSGDPAVIFERAITLLVAHLARQKTAATARPRHPRRAKTASRHIPAVVKRTIWQRDGGRCAFEGTHGRCTETGFLEYHHVVPFAAGGETSVGNLQLRCRAHNGYEAEQ